MEAAPPRAPEANPTPAPAVRARELELKLLVEPADLATLRRSRRVSELAQGRATTRRLRSVYYDTPDLELLREGLTLRVRRVGRRFVQTLKGTARGRSGLMDRTEYEVGVPSEAPDLARIPDLELRARLERVAARAPLAPVVETEVTRTSRRLRIEETELVFDLDVGETRTARGTAPICELELELVEGEPHHLYALALELQRHTRLRVTTRSKAERGLELLTGAVPSPKRAQAIQTLPDATLETALEAIFASCIGQMLANEEPARRGVDPEGVHQMRVGVRRLRSALSLFRSVLPDEALEPLRVELRWLADALGEPRDLDVFVDETLAPLRHRFPTDPHLKRLADEAETMRREAYDCLQAALDSLRYAELILRLGHWVESRGWRQQALTPQSAALFLPARQLAHGLLDGRHRTVRRRGRGIAQRSEADQHELRIRIKKLRYAAEFLRPLYARKPSKRYAQGARDLQEVLGHLNDAATARRLLARLVEHLGEDASPELLGAVGFVEGWVARGADLQLTGLDAAWTRFKKQPAFWRDRGTPPG